MYVCTFCNKPSKPGEQMHRFTEFGQSAHHAGVDIVRESPICTGCSILVNNGIPASVIRRQGGKPIKTYSTPSASEKEEVPDNGDRDRRGIGGKRRGRSVLRDFKRGL